jgi:molybdopterin/thiamine biosynthesis adenylyltransferase
LEWGPDNWRSDVTAADMLNSAYKLLDTENPYGNDDEHQAVPSRHFLTAGQVNRGKYLRLVLDNEAVSFIKDLPISEKISFTVVYSLGNDVLTFHITKILSSENTWINEKIPLKLKNKDLFDYECGLLCHTNVNKDQFSKITSFEELEDLIQKIDGENIILDEVKDPETKSAQKIYLLAFVTQENDIVCLLKVNDKVYNTSVIEDNDHANRNPSYLENIASKKVGIVGLGSVGSKVAVSLARVGINQLYLIDEELFSSVNIQRHVLDWRNVGEHKVKALEKVLAYISPKIQVESEIINLDAQESNTYLNKALTELGQCDIIIDCTANPTVFNILSAIYRVYEISIVWCEVFAGGIGGMIARSRFGKDPAPEFIREAYNNYIIENPDSEYKTIGNYAAEDTSGQIFTASDADVSVVSAHLTKFAIDTILDSEVSMYPYSLYLIGMSNAWVFDQPFCTIPIATAGLEIEENIPKLNEKEQRDVVNFLTDLVENSNHVHDTDK